MSAALIMASVLIGAAGTVETPGTLTSTASVERTPWDSARRFGVAAAELAFVELSVWAVDKWPRGMDWADVTPDTWWRNISEGWEYDGDGFQTNYFGHPYHGSLFFNVARSNGYDFYESLAFALAGSALWEYFGETYRPAFNDWLTTGLSGSNLGEVLHRLSIATTDNTAVGLERVIRELAGAAIDPPRGLNRLISGDFAAVFSNPEEHRPENFRGDFQVGVRLIDADGRTGVEHSIYQGLVEVELSSGRLFPRREEPPFSWFRFATGVSFGVMPAFTRIMSEGSLLSVTVHDERAIKHRLALSLAYDYVNNPAFEVGLTGLTGSWDGYYLLPGDLVLAPGIALRLVMMGATPNDYFTAEDGRDYDFGPAQACLDANVAMVNCMPVFIASSVEWAERFRSRGLPVIGDDIKSQFGATIVHRSLARLLTDRGVKLERTYQLNTGGNTDFLNMLERERLKSKKISKTESVQSQLDVPLEPENIHIGPSDFVPWQKDNKVCFLRLEWLGFGEVPMNLELRMSVEDSPNSAGIAVDAIRLAKLALDRGVAGPVESAAAYLMKHPPRQMRDEEARLAVERFIAGK